MLATAYPRAVSRSAAMLSASASYVASPGIQRISGHGPLPPAGAYNVARSGTPSMVSYVYATGVRYGGGSPLTIVIVARGARIEAPLASGSSIEQLLRGAGSAFAGMWIGIVAEVWPGANVSVPCAAT